MVIPPAFGLAGVKQATYTGDGDITYWNNYVAVTQMAGHGNFKEPRLGIDVVAKGEDLVTPKLPALREYQHSLAKPAPPAGSFDAAAAGRGQGAVRRGGASARPATRAPRSRTRSCTRRRRRGWTRPTPPAAPRRSTGPRPCGRCGSTRRTSTTARRRTWPRWWTTTTPTLKLKLSAEQKKDLVEYLKSI